MNIVSLSLTALVGMMLLNACGGSKKPLTPEQQSEVSSFDASQLDELEVQLHKGLNDDDLLFYAPLSVEGVKDALEDAKGTELKIEKLAAYNTGKNALDHAYKTKTAVIKYLSDIADLNERMKTAHTNVVFTDRYEDFIDDYNDLIVLMDKDKTSEALEDKVKMMHEANDLYGDTIVYNNINAAYVILENMDDNDLDDESPEHYEKASLIYEKSRLNIKKTPDDTEIVKKESRNAIESATFAQTLANDVLALKELKKDEYEAYFSKLHRRIALLNNDESNNPILPYPIYEKISRLQSVREQEIATDKSEIINETRHVEVPEAVEPVSPVKPITDESPMVEVETVGSDMNASAVVADVTVETVAQETTKETVAVEEVTVEKVAQETEKETVVVEEKISETLPEVK